MVAADAREPVVLETERLLLVPLESSRSEELTAIYADPEVARYIGADRLSAEGTRAQVTAFKQVWREHGYGQSALLERATGRMIGRTGLHPRSFVRADPRGELDPQRFDQGCWQ